MLRKAAFEELPDDPLNRRAQGPMLPDEAGGPAAQQLPEVLLHEPAGGGRRESALVNDLRYIEQLFIPFSITAVSCSGRILHSERRRGRQIPRPASDLATILRPLTSFCRETRYCPDFAGPISGATGVDFSDAEAGISIENSSSTGACETCARCSATRVFGMHLK